MMVLMPKKEVTIKLSVKRDYMLQNIIVILGRPGSRVVKDAYR